MNYILAPSILSADFSNLGDAVSRIDKTAAEWIHIDVMDGVFVPNISFGMPIIKAVRGITQKPFDVHLMIVQPERYIANFKAAGADILTVHLEACTHLHRTIQEIKYQGMKAGVALNPHSSITLLEDCMADIDLICVMSVNPGFGGQRFIENTYRKVENLKDSILSNNSSALIEIDGGVTLENRDKLLACGADILVAGNSVFKANKMEENIALFKL
jgi:ribulose-phosphate 3-epimerase